MTSMPTDWKAIYNSGCALPAHANLDTLTMELAACLADPDPAIRDGEPYAVLGTWIAQDVIDRPRRRRLGDLMAERFTDPRIHVRTFAALVLDMIVSRRDFDPAWLEAFCGWYPAESDLRGYDEQVGWLHAVAHGADLLGTLGRHPGVDATRMLDVAAQRLLAPTEMVWGEQEDDRLGHAIALTLTRADLDEAAATAWLAPIAADFTVIRRGRTPAYRSNTMRTLRMLYAFADLGVPPARGSAALALPHAAAIKAHLVPLLAEAFRSS